MSRSKHTRPRHILAASRLRAPYAPRGAGDPSRQRRITRILKESGIVSLPTDSQRRRIACFPRITIQQPQTGYYHPLTKTDIEDALRFFGEVCYYGLRLIKLLQSPAQISVGRLAFGRLAVPGLIILYAQPESHWTTNGTVSAEQHDILCRGGARVEITDMNMRTRVEWPSEALRYFMLFDVLMHEVGHHIIQQYKGKRTIRVVRTRDHESCADRFAAQCRLAYQHNAEDI